MNSKKLSKNRTALSMRGGGARCTGYLGVIKALEENDIKPDLMIGSSMGAIIGCLYALGYSVEEMINLEKNVNVLSFLGINSLKEGSLVSGSKVVEALEKILGKKRLEETNIKMYIQATDLAKRRPVVFSKGEIAKLIAASSAFPFLISPTRIGGRLYLDGDISSGYAANFLRKRGASIVIGMYPGKLPLKNYHNFLTKFRLPMATLYAQLLELDLLVNPVDVLIKDFGVQMDFLDFRKIDELVDGGYKAAMKQMPRLKSLVFQNHSKKHSDVEI